MILAPLSEDALPDPCSLDASEVARLFAMLRQRRIALLDRLAAFEGATHGTAMLDRMEAQVEMLDLLGYLRRLQARAKALETWEPADTLPPTFADLAGDGAHWVEARGLCPLTPDSVLFIHAPVSLYFVAALAERLLHPGDCLAWLRKAGFHKELSSEPRILVWDIAMGPPPQQLDRAAACIEGVFETAQGRRLAFAALPDPAYPAQRKADYHSLVPIINANPPNFDHETGRFRYILQPGGWPPAVLEVGGAAAVFALTECLVTSVSLALNDGRRMYLFSTIANRRIPQDFGLWLAQKPELQVEFEWAKARSIPGRGDFIPGRYRFVPDDDNWTRGVMVRLDSHLLF